MSGRRRPRRLSRQGRAQTRAWRREAREVKDASKSRSAELLTGSILFLGIITLALSGMFGWLTLIGLLLAGGFMLTYFQTGKMPDEAVRSFNDHADKWRDNGMLFSLDGRRRK